jgi:UDPglucose 6-dehydrogenase
VQRIAETFTNPGSRVLASQQVRRGIGADPRIGFHFLYPGAGYGGSCFPKDVKAIVKTAADAGIGLQLLAAVEQVNDAQKRVLVDKVVGRFGESLAGRTFGIWGLAFKPNTDDMREAPSLVIVAELLARGAAVQAYDPAAMESARRAFGAGTRIAYAGSPLEAVAGADALVIVTEWKEFRSPDFDGIRARLKAPVIFDGRNLYEPADVARLGFEYFPMGRTVGRSGAAR